MRDCGRFPLAFDGMACTVVMPSVVFTVASPAVGSVLLIRSSRSAKVAFAGLPALLRI
jgi:hypothetical protein